MNNLEIVNKSLLEVKEFATLFTELDDVNAIVHLKDIISQAKDENNVS